MTDALAQPYPDRIRELEREVERLRDVMKLAKPGVVVIAYEDGCHQRLARAAVNARERAEIAEEKLDTTRQQYMDADHMLRLRDTECRRLRSEASELMAKEADQTLLIGMLRQDVNRLERERDRIIEAKAEQRAEIEWLKNNAKRQAEVIREQGAEIERLTKADDGVTGYRITETPRLREWVRSTGQTRAETDAMAREPSYFTEEETAVHRQQLRDGHAKAKEALAQARERAAMASLAHTLDGIDNEERD